MRISLVHEDDIASDKSNEQFLHDLLLGFGPEDRYTMTKAAKSPVSIECNPFYILVCHFFFVGGDIVSVEELFFVIVPITKRLIRRSKNLLVNSLNLI